MIQCDPRDPWNRHLTPTMGVEILVGEDELDFISEWWVRPSNHPIQILSAFILHGTF